MEKLLQNIAVMRFSRQLLAATAALMLLCVGILAVRGLSTSVDFSGGSVVSVAFAEDALPPAGALAALAQEALADVEFSEGAPLAGGALVELRSVGLSEEQVASLSAAIAGQFAGAEVSRVFTVGPTVGKVFRQEVLTAGLVALAAVVLFVAYAFRGSGREGLSGMKMGLVTVATLAHDALVIMAVFALLGLPVGTLFFTALLTVIGFSVNDTIVVFDRLREVLRTEKSLSLAAAADRAIRSSVRRSVLTSVSTLVVIIALLVASATLVPEMRAFFLALALGVVVGTYSSLAVAAPLLVQISKSQQSAKHKAS